MFVYNGHLGCFHTLLYVYHSIEKCFDTQHKTHMIKVCLQKSCATKYNNHLQPSNFCTNDALMCHVPIVNGIG